MFANWLTKIMTGSETNEPFPNTMELQQDREKLVEENSLELNVPEETINDSSYQDMSEEDDEEDFFGDCAEDVDDDEDFLTNSQTPSLPSSSSSMGSRPTESAVLKKAQELKEMVLEFSGVIEGMEHRMDVLETNQECIHVAVGECMNEILRTKQYAKNRNRELIRDIMDMNYEQANLVVYDIPLSIWHEFLSYYKKPSLAIKMYAMSFIHEYWPNYEEIDVKAKKLQQDSAEGTGDPTKWRCLIKMGSPGDAIKLKNRCLRSGFYSIRSGLTPLQRDYIQEIQKHVEAENKKRGDDSETILKRKFQHRVCEVKRSDGSFVKWLPYHNASAPLFKSKMQPSLTILKPKNASAHDSSSTNGSTVTATKKNLAVAGRSSRQAVTPSTRHKRVDTTTPKNTSTGPPKAHTAPTKSSNLSKVSLAPLAGSNSGGGSGVPKAKSLATADSQSRKRRAVEGPGVKSPPAKRGPGPRTAGTKTTKNGMKSAKNAKPNTLTKFLTKGGKGAPSAISKTDTPKKRTKTEINKMKITTVRPLLQQSQEKVYELKAANQELEDSNKELLQKIADLQAQADFRKSLE